MKQPTAMGLVLIVGAAACGVAWALLPSLQGSRAAVESEAAVHLERARRLLHAYDAEFAYQDAVIGQLRDAGIAGDDTDALSDDALDTYQQVHTRMWDVFEPTNWGEYPQKARANYGDVEGQMSRGVADRDRILDRNERLLDQASQAIDHALAVQAGDATGRELAEALRLKGSIQFYRGMADRIRAAVWRLDADPIRDELRKLIDRAMELQAIQSLVANSGIADRIAQMRDRSAQAEQTVADQRTQLAGLERTIADFEQRIASAKTRRDRAEAEMRRLRDQGLDFSRPDAAKEYKRAYLAADRSFREADRQVRSLTVGSLPRARIDASGDFLTGRYVENGSPFKLTTEPGLTHYQGERDVAAKVLAEREVEVGRFRATIARLEALRERYAKEEADARDELRSVREHAADALAELTAIQSEASEVEDDALNELDKAARAMRDAANQASRWVSDARDHTRNMSPSASQRSAFTPRTDDDWMGGFIQAQIADARLAKAWVYYDRFQAAVRTADLLDRAAGALQLADADAVDQRTIAEDARDAGVDEVKEAMNDLKRAHRAVGNHWTVVAQAAGTQYLLVLFGDNSYVAETVDAYREAVKGREDNESAGPIVARLRQLERQ